MQYEVQINGTGYTDYVIREDGTLVMNSGSKPAVVTYIRALCPIDAREINSSQAFALFALIMQLHQELNTPVVTGDVSWSDIVSGAK